MENRRKNELAAMGHEIYLGSYELHDAACEKGMQMNSKDEVSDDEWAVVDLNEECLGCNAYKTGVELMEKLLSMKDLCRMINA